MEGPILLGVLLGVLFGWLTVVSTVLFATGLKVNDLKKDVENLNRKVE